jgi:hypothetical protein
MRGRPWVRDKRTSILVGGVLTVVGFVILYDAWEGRGGKKPRLLGPLLPW